jgi:hypothetical protein
MERSLGDVGGIDVDSKGRALAIVLLKVLGGDPVGLGALLAPGRAPDPRPLENSVWVDNTVFAVLIDTGPSR